MRPYSSRGGCPELRHFESLELYDKMAVGYTISFFQIHAIFAEPFTSCRREYGPDLVADAFAVP